MSGPSSPDGGPPANEFRILCLDGGGYLGLATAAFLAECERYHKVKCSEIFDLFCGTSTGGLIALALASGKSAAEIVSLYKRLGSIVFQNRGWWKRAYRFARGLVLAKYGNRELASVLDDVFGGTTFADVSARGKNLVVPAFCLTTGRPRVFKTDHSPELNAHSGYRLRDVALATSAAPTYFPVVTISSPTSGAPERFIDGGVCANNPALLAYAEAIGYLKRDVGEIRMLSVSTPRTTLSEGPVGRRDNLGVAQWARKLPDLFINGPSDLTDRALGRILPSAGYMRVQLANEHRLQIDDASDEATNLLVNLGSDFAADTTRRNEMARFFRSSNGRDSEAFREVPCHDSHGL